MTAGKVQSYAKLKKQGQEPDQSGSQGNGTAPPSEVEPRGLKKALVIFRNKLFAGVFVAIPTVVTIWVLVSAYEFIAWLSSPVTDPILRKLGRDPEAFRWMAVLLTLALLFGLGVLATNVLGKRLIEALESIVLRIPIAASIYNGIKQIIDSVTQFGGKMSQFKRVAYVEYPSEGCRLLGFVTGQYDDPLSEEHVTCVFIPTSPNPMTGFVVVTPTERLIESSMTLEEATKFILSAGLVGPRVTSEKSAATHSAIKALGDLAESAKSSPATKHNVDGAPPPGVSPANQPPPPAAAPAPEPDFPPTPTSPAQPSVSPRSADVAER